LEILNFARKYNVIIVIIVVVVVVVAAVVKAVAVESPSGRAIYGLIALKCPIAILLSS
jgi:hypothetical protein